MPDILVIRFGSLGDLCLLGWSLAALADGAGEIRPRITLATKAEYAPLMEQMRGVDAVEALVGRGPVSLKRLATRLRGRPWQQVLDAHAILRGDVLQILMTRRADERLGKDTAHRLRMLLAARLGRGPGANLEPAPVRAMRDRFDTLVASALPTAGTTLPADARPPLVHLAAAADSGAPLGLAPGAQWATKRWPVAAFAELLRLYRERSDRAVRIFLGPRESIWFTGSELANVAADLPDVEIVRNRPLVATAASLAACRHLVTNDSGLLHLAEAAGTPVLALFGPTVRGFGYFPRLAASRVLETALACRPCSRNGKRACRRGDQACLTRITPADALAALTTLEEAS